jgi:DNA processing protein
MDGSPEFWRACCATVVENALGRQPTRLAETLGQLAVRHGAAHSAGELRDFTTRRLRSLGVSAEWSVGERAARWLTAAPGRHLILRGDPSYPFLLSAIADPPALLWVDGDPGLLARPQLAVVGSRRATPGGRQIARRLAHDLARSGLVVTSGLATGIDAAAHAGALEAGAPTIAVYGCGIDRVYPAVHRALAGELRCRGALVSEFAPGVHPQPWLFPRRNRVISGLALGTLVVEAAATSGSLVTARHALDQGREVFAVPGSIHNPLSRGCHQLLRDGAVLTETAADVVAELRGFQAARVERDGPDGTRSGAVELSSPERRVFEACDFTPLGLDEVVDQSGLTAPEVSSILTALELRGLIAAAPGGCYVRTGKMPA